MEQRGPLPESQVVDFKLGLYHARRPQPHSEDVHLCGHVVCRREAAHVLKETEQREKKKKG